MTVFNPSYLVKSRHGIWYFQIQIPLEFRKNNSRALIRRSLRTRDLNIALSRSKFWYLKVVELKYDLSDLQDIKDTNNVFTSQKTLFDCIEMFIAEKRRGWKESHAFVNEHKGYRPKLSLLAEILGNSFVDQITKSDIVKYKNTVFKLPSNRNKKPIYAGKTFKQLMDMEIPNQDLLSSTTISNHFVKVSSFLSWLRKLPHIRHR